MIVTLAARVLQLIFATIILGLSVSLLTGFGRLESRNTSDKDKMPESALITYGAFCGALGFIVGAIGIVACFIESLQGIITLALDGIAAFLFAAAGIAFAVKTGVGNCAEDKMNGKTYPDRHYDLFRVSKYKYTNQDSQRTADDDFIGRCRSIQADTAFIWFMFGMVAVTVALGIFSKSGKRGGAMV